MDGQTILFDTSATRNLARLRRWEWADVHVHWARQGLQTCWLPWTIRELMGSNLRTVVDARDKAGFSEVTLAGQRFNELACGCVAPDVPDLMASSFYAALNLDGPEPDDSRSHALSAYLSCALRVKHMHEVSAGPQGETQLLPGGSVPGMSLEQPDRLSAGLFVERIDRRLRASPLSVDGLRRIQHEGLRHGNALPLFRAVLKWMVTPVVDPWTPEPAEPYVVDLLAFARDLTALGVEQVWTAIHAPAFRSTYMFSNYFFTVIWRALPALGVCGSRWRFNDVVDLHSVSYVSSGATLVSDDQHGAWRLGRLVLDRSVRIVTLEEFLQRLRAPQSFS